MKSREPNIDYCGVIHLLRYLIATGNCTKKEAQNIAAELAVQYGADIIISL